MAPTGAPLYHGTYGEIAAALAARLAARRSPSSPFEPVGIIVPSRSAAEELARRLVGPAGAVAGLLTMQVDQFALRVLNDRGRYPRVADGAESALAMELALRAAGDELASIHGAAAMLLRTHRDVRDSGLSLDELSARVTRQKSLRNRDRIASAVAVWKRYEALLAEGGATVGADLLAAASRAIREGARIAPQIVFGYYDATAAQLDVLRALAGAGLVDSVWLPAPLDASTSRPEPDFAYAAPFVEALLGGNIEIAGPAAADDRAGAWEIRDFPSPMAEIRETCREIRRLVDGGAPPSSCAIVMRSTEAPQLALLDRVARDFGIELRGVPGAPVAANRIVRGVLSLLRVARGGLVRRDVMEVVRSGVRPGALGAIPELARLERATRRAGIARASASDVRALAKSRQDEREQSEPDADLLGYATLVERIARETKKAAGALRGAAWGDELERWLNLFEAETRDDVDAVIRLRGIAAMLRRAPFAAAKIDADDVRRTIEETGELRRDETAAAVWVGDVMRFRGRTAEHLFVIGATHDKLPQRRVDDPLLPDGDRARLGVRAVGDGREEERFLFAALVDSARASIRFSFAAADGVGKALRPSSLLKDFAIGRLPGERREILHDFRGWRRGRNPSRTGPSAASERRVAVLLARPTPPFLRQLQLAALRGGASPFDGFVEPGEALESKVRSIFASVSPSTIEHLGACPQRFYVSALLGARELEEPDDGIAIDSREKGTIDHVILERFYRSLATSQFAFAAAGDSLHPGLRERLGEEIDRAFAELDAKVPPRNPTLRAIERDETLASLAEFVQSDFRQLAEGGWLPHEYELEISSGDDAAAIDVAGVRLGISGRVDRIDKGTDGSVRVVDYKSGKAGHLKGLEGKIAEGLQLQTAIYALVVARAYDLDPERVSARILPLRDPDLKPEKFSFSLAAVEEGLRSTLETLVGAAIAGRFPAVPSKDACKYCFVRHWCRERHETEEAGHSVLELLGEVDA